jgi:mono/diheme cytochrome c family protein
MRTVRNFGSVALILTFALLACARKPAPSRPEAATRPAYELRLGKGTYVHYCQTCHGETGAGDGFNAFNLDPRPRDFSSPGFQKTKSDADLADAIRRGGAGVGLSPLMPPWGHTLSSRQIDAVVLYLRSLPKQAGPQPAADQRSRDASPAAGP